MSFSEMRKIFLKKKAISYVFFFVFSLFCLFLCNFTCIYIIFVMLEKSKGVVLRQLKYNDESMIVDIYTEQRGAVSFMVRIPRSRKSASNLTLLRPLSLVDLEYDYRPQHSLQRIKEVGLDIPYKTLPYDPLKTMLALFLGEFLCYSLKHEVRNPSLFQYLSAGLQWLDRSEESVANFHLVFLMRMTLFLGFMPQIEKEHSAGERRLRMSLPATYMFDLREGILTEIRPMHRDFLDPQETRLIPFIWRMDFATMHLYKFSRMQRVRILEILIDYYRLHVPEFPELKSLEVLSGIL